MTTAGEGVAEDCRQLRPAAPMTPSNRTSPPPLTAMERIAELERLVLEAQLADLQSARRQAQLAEGIARLAEAIGNCDLAIRAIFALHERLPGETKPELSGRGSRRDPN